MTIASTISFGGMAGAHRHRLAGIGPDDGALLRHHLQRPQRAGILRRVRIDQIGERHGDRRMHVGMRGVHEARHLRIALGEIDLDVAAALGDFGGDPDVVVAAAVVVEEGLAEERAVLPGRDHRARLRLGGIEHGFDRGFDGRRAELGEQFLQAPLAEMRGADHRRRGRRGNRGGCATLSASMSRMSSRSRPAS